jgi:hypothetical protein
LELNSIYLQLRSALGPEAITCAVRNLDIAKLNVVVTFVTDIILLLMMLAGLLHLRQQGGGMLDLGNFLWKQVGGFTFPLS